MAGIKLSPGEAKTLQALRAAPMDTSQIGERFDKNYCPRLIANGLVLFESGFYKITALGRDLCPNRREAMLPVAPKVAKQIERKTMNTESKALQILRYIEKFNGASNRQIIDVVDVLSVDGYLSPYILKGHVIKIKNDGDGPMLFKIAEGQKVDDFYKGKSKKAAVKNEVLVDKTTINATPVAEVVPQFIAAVAEPAKSPVCDFVQVEKPQKIESFAEAKNIAEAILPIKQKIRFAMTSDNTLIIQGAGYSDIELDAATTLALVEFIEGASMMLPTHSHSVGGAAL